MRRVRVPDRDDVPFAKRQGISDRDHIDALVPEERDASDPSVLRVKGIRQQEERNRTSRDAKLVKHRAIRNTLSVRSQRLGPWSLVLGHWSLVLGPWSACASLSAR